ncbi:sensor histidine kinase [Luteibacter yeojuensis]|uniref:sensor histidine kinase n=1 Tax=Luteibacter yeojuensis TaxID=345309 RepID=UPI0006990C46|nr:histidine kinase [Luteibacter yeojuensis]
MPLPAIYIAGFWFVVGAINLVLLSLDAFRKGPFITDSLTSLCGCLLSFGLLWVTRHVARPRRPWRNMARWAAVVAAGTALWAFDSLMQAWTTGHPPWGRWPDDWFMPLRMNWVYFTALYALQMVILALVESIDALRTRERQLLEARLAALRFQLNPHFLFNTLNAISTLVAEASVREAGEMIERLSRFLRASLTGEPTDLVSLSAELDMIHAYLDIEAIRFGDRLNVRYACQAGLAEAQVPSFILQPLVENAVKYAVAPAKQAVTIAIEASAENESLILVVEDDGRHDHAMAVPGTGVGLRNVAARLDALYGPAARMEAVRRERGFTAVIRLPLQWSAT